MQHIWVKGQRYNYYESYDTAEEAKKVAIYKRKTTKTRYFIIKTEEGFLFPKTRYRLYLNKVIKLWQI